MKLLLIAGFLGSGKTTLLIQIAHHLVSASQSIAIVENEMGEIGVDGDYLNLEGLQVQELFGGCICCTLSTGLISTLEKVEELYHPDTVILEATGAARPGDILNNLNTYQSRVDGIQVITVVDANRYPMLKEMMEPLLTAQVEAADIVVINKIDQVEPEQVDLIKKETADLNKEAVIEAISAENKSSINIIADALQ